MIERKAQDLPIPSEEWPTEIHEMDASGTLSYHASMDGPNVVQLFSLIMGGEGPNQTVTHVVAYNGTIGPGDIVRYRKDSPEVVIGMSPEEEANVLAAMNDRLQDRKIFGGYSGAAREDVLSDESDETLQFVFFSTQAILGETSRSG